MTLREFLFYSRISITDMAKTLGISRCHLSRVANGALEPSNRLSKAIYLFSHGKVQLAQENMVEKKKKA